MQTHELKVADSGAEYVPYNEAGYPLYAGYGRLRSFRGMGVIDHWHGDWEFALVLRGSVRYTINQSSVTLRAGEALFINSGQIHRNDSPDGTDGEYLCVLIHPSFMQMAIHAVSELLLELCDSRQLSHVVLKPEAAWQKAIIDELPELYQRIVEGITPNLLAILAGSFRVMHILRSNLSQIRKNEIVADDLIAMREMMEYIQQHFRGRIRISDISRAGRVGSSTCYSMFRRFLGMPPMRYVLDYRLARACARLQDSDEPIAEIAEATGFSSPSYFSECFRARYAVTPTDYRAALRQGASAQ